MNESFPHDCDSIIPMNYPFIGVNESFIRINDPFIYMRESFGDDPFERIYQRDTPAQKKN